MSGSQLWLPLQPNFQLTVTGSHHACKAAKRIHFILNLAFPIFLLALIWVASFSSQGRGFSEVNTSLAAHSSTAPALPCSPPPGREEAAPESSEDAWKVPSVSRP